MRGTKAKKKINHHGRAKKAKNMSAQMTKS